MSIHDLVAEEQPENFEFTAENEAEIIKIIAKYPEGRQASAVMPLLDLAQRQHDNWIPMKAIEVIAEKLGMAKIRVLEVASFYTMFNLKPVGKYFLQLCGTTPCMLRGSDDLSRCIKDKLGITSGQITPDGKFSLLEVECLGACVNAPIIQVNDDFYEDLDYDSTEALIDALSNDMPPPVGSVIKRSGSQAETGATSLSDILGSKSAKPSKKPDAKSKKTAASSAKISGV
ncbi:NADH-quinone oxidoreductase subunit NuoE [Alphaproteobacteria bacterium]|jgi:NADH-quinone oxidoreductase E subunit|nr:NADH-quinone oxidoreductase subunit NuoE [Alphaproteobacteria bacterium]MDC0394454.1 NADH-quinone oxidoreductase subunit NuoE [Alphaproteobacteria bacterium]MDC0461527.1 NADH-quinone oxidoreductase subunit NuoE [Alphaproteobacteria bacterium]MDC3311957.1 NADH-quinone oxidoreductase subunit NuoE [Alphaproteobacteria bacterium]